MWGFHKVLFSIYICTFDIKFSCYNRTQTWRCHEYWRIQVTTVNMTLNVFYYVGKVGTKLFRCRDSGQISNSDIYYIMDIKAATHVIQWPCAFVKCFARIFLIVEVLMYKPSHVLKIAFKKMYDFPCNPIKPWRR